MIIFQAVYILPILKTNAQKYHSNPDQSRVNRYPVVGRRESTRATAARVKRKEVKLSRFFGLSGFSLKMGSATWQSVTSKIELWRHNYLPCSSFPSIPVAWTEQGFPWTHGGAKSLGTQGNLDTRKQESAKWYIMKAVKAERWMNMVEIRQQTRGPLPAPQSCGRWDHSLRPPRAQAGQGRT